MENSSSSSTNLDALSRTFSKLLHHHQRPRPTTPTPTTTATTATTSSISSSSPPPLQTLSSLLAQSPPSPPSPHKSHSPSSSPHSAIADSLVAELFASVSAIKASYAELQLAQSPFDPASIHSADLAIVDELRHVSDLKHSYLAHQLLPNPNPNSSPSPLLSLLREQRNLLRTYEITSKQLESELDSSYSRLRSLRSELSDLAHANRALESRLRGPRSLAGLHLSGLDPTHLLAALRGAVGAVKSFAKLMARRMERAAPPWDLDAAARAVHPGAAAALREPRHRSFAFVSYVCHKMFSDFHHRDFNTKSLEERHGWDRRRFFAEFAKVRSASARQVLDGGIDSLGFEGFCRAKYLSVVGPKMEAAIFGSPAVRGGAAAAGGWPEREWGAGFAEVAIRVWALHCLFYSFGEEMGAAIFQVRRGARFSHVYMENVERDGLGIGPAVGPAVAFTVVPGFRVGKTIIQCRVYLESKEENGRP